MVATNGVAHQVGKSFINRVQVMPRKQTSTSIEELERQKKIICILFQKVDALLLPRPSGRGQAQVIKNISLVQGVFLTGPPLNLLSVGW